MLTCCSYCLQATLLTSKPCSPLCLRRNGGTIAVSLRCFAMVNYDRRLEHLPMPPDTRVPEWWRGSLASCSSTGHCLVPCHHITCPYETEVHYAPRYKATLVENSVCIMKSKGNLCPKVDLTRKILPYIIIKKNI